MLLLSCIYYRICILSIFLFDVFYTTLVDWIKLLLIYSFFYLLAQPCISSKNQIKVSKQNFSYFFKINFLTFIVVELKPKNCISQSENCNIVKCNNDGLTKFFKRQRFSKQNPSKSLVFKDSSTSYRNIVVRVTSSAFLQ